MSTTIKKSFNYVSIMILLIMVLIACGGEVKNVQLNDHKGTKEVSYFDAYKDTLVRLSDLNAELGTEYNIISLGKPVGVLGTPYWLITVGGWTLNNRNIQIQGSKFEEGNRFYPNPIRKTEVEFVGSITGIIRFDQVTKEYIWLLKDVDLNFFTYQRTDNYHLLVLNEDRSGLDFIEVTTGKRIDLQPNEGELEDWSLNEMTDELIFLTQVGNKDEMNVDSFRLSELTSTDG